jgi:hypothetical protein
LLNVGSANAQQGCLEPPGDVNQNGFANIVDVQCLILTAFWQIDGMLSAVPSCLAVPPAFADLNCSKSRNVADIQLSIAYTLGQKLSAVIDADGSNCPDACEVVAFVCGDGVCEANEGESCGNCPADCDGCTGECCGANAEPGCEDPTCTWCVCSEDSFCCTAFWDGMCAATAEQACGGFCDCSGDCCAAHGGKGCDNEGCESCVCDADPFCCTGAWDADCAALAAGACADTCLCPGAPASCCATGDAPGCAATACETCVCAGDPFCCTDAWDLLCVEAAEQDCAGLCACSGAPAGTCCGGGAAPGCGVAACEACVCATDSSCCDTQWDALCAIVAGASCGPTCGCAPQDSCCEPRNAAGCPSNAGCQGCVCGADSFCCDVVWDNLCAAVAEFDCPTCGCP